jgi:hypothetical protein
MRPGAIFLVASCFGFWCLPQVLTVPVPRLSHEEMMQAADVVVEGRVVGVTLTRRWIGDRPGVDIGYEHGHFEVWFFITKAIKGHYQKNQTLQYSVRAYMEGKWNNLPPMGFVYEGTAHAVTPGTTLRVYLKWDEEHKRYQRVHFNSGFVVLEESDNRYPDTVGIPAFAKSE